MLLAALALVGLFVALYLALYKLGYIGQLTCTVGGCETVNTSRWATFLGLPVAVWGVGFYLAVLAVSLVGVRERHADERWVSLLMTFLTGWGVLFSAYLTALELFVIHAICMWCVISAVIVTIMFVVSVLELRERRDEKRETRDGGYQLES
jgi:uncharacterized membrane protein